MAWTLRGLMMAMLPLVLLAGRAEAQDQGFAGSWEASAPNGTKISLVLRQDGRRVVGTLTGNGSRFEVEGEIAADGGFYGSARGQGGTLFIGGERNGAQLGVALAEMTAAGVPDMRTAQELRMLRVSTGADAGGVAGTPLGAAVPGKPSARAGAAPGSVPSSGSAPNTSSAGSPADQQLSQLLISSPWCYMRYSQQMGATTTERVVFTADGRLVSRQQRESAVNNQAGSYYGNSTDGQQGFWRVQNGNLMLSADGRSYDATPLTVTRNSNGYPIVTAAGKEYNQCN